jgi:hypothetical protein
MSSLILRVYRILSVNFFKLRHPEKLQDIGLANKFLDKKAQATKAKINK